MVNSTWARILVLSSYYSATLLTLNGTNTFVQILIYLVAKGNFLVALVMGLILTSFW